MNDASNHTSPMKWIPTLYFAKGLPYIIVMVVAMVLLRQKGLSNTIVTQIIALFYLPWVLKPWWKPRLLQLVDCRTLVLLTDALTVFVFMLLAAFVGNSWQTVAWLLWLVAALNAVHNSAADAYYRLTLHEDERYGYRHLRELSRKCAIVVGQGVLVMLAGNLQVLYRNNIAFSWSITFYGVAGIFLLLFFWHLYALRPVSVVAASDSTPVGRLSATVAAFLLGYGLSYAFLAKVSVLFLIDTTRRGGLGLAPQELGLVLGAVGIIGLTIGGAWGTNILRRYSHGNLRWVMATAMLIPSLCYCLLSLLHPSDLFTIGVLVGLEQLCFGFGFAYYLQQMYHFPGGEMKKSLMALMFLVPCLLSGWLQSLMGYQAYFALTCVLGLLPFVVVRNREIPKVK